jgi:general stress protein YciG
LKTARRLYEYIHGKVPEQMEVHHIIPVHAGGETVIENLVALTKRDHKLEHLFRYVKYGNFRDLCSYFMIDYNFTEAHKISSSIGGKIGGNKVKNLEVGICTKDTEKRKTWASMGGKIGGKVQAERGEGFHQFHHFDKTKHLEICSAGGKASPVFKDPKRQSEFGKIGGPKNKGFIWYTDGIKMYKYTKVEQENLSFENFLKNNKQFKKGRK